MKKIFSNLSMVLGAAMLLGLGIYMSGHSCPDMKSTIYMMVAAASGCGLFFGGFYASDLIDRG